MDRDSDVVELRKCKDREKLIQMGLEQNPDVEDIYQDNIQYLRDLGTTCRKIIRRIEFLKENPGTEELEVFADEIREDYFAVEAMRKRSEEANGEKFVTTQQMEILDLSPEEETVIKFLYSARGVGIAPLEPGIKGEVLMLLLNILYGLPVERGRKLLHKDEKLSSERCIYPEYQRLFLEGGKKAYSRETRISSFIEGQQYEINEILVDILSEAKPSGKYMVKREDVGNIHDEREYAQYQRYNKLVRQVNTDVSLSDVVLEDGLREEIQGVMTHIKHWDKIYDDWDLGRVVGTGKGINVLFTGPPGTGKTLTAKALGRELGMDVFIVGFDQLINCYYGETEKNVDALFKVLEKRDTLLLIDEADAILYRRRTSSHSVSNTENRVINIFLQRLEEHSGVMIFTSNLAKDMDRALERRMSLKVIFPEPKTKERKDIWKMHIPDKMPIADDVDLDELASTFKFSGGKIKNAVVNAAKRALTHGREVVTHADFVNACKAESKGHEVMEYSLEKDEVCPEGYL